MFCGDAIGNFLPPMVVYKAKNVYDNWKKNGPKGKINIFVTEIVTSTYYGNFVLKYLDAFKRFVNL